MNNSDTRGGQEQKNGIDGRIASAVIAVTILAVLAMAYSIFTGTPNRVQDNTTVFKRPDKKPFTPRNRQAPFNPQAAAETPDGHRRSPDAPGR